MLTTRVLRGELDQRVDVALDDDPQRDPVGRGIQALETGQHAKGVECRHGGERQFEVVMPDVLQFRDAADARQAAVTDDRHPIAGGLHFRQHV